MSKAMYVYWKYCLSGAFQEGKLSWTSKNNSLCENLILESFIQDIYQTWTRTICETFPLEHLLFSNNARIFMLVKYHLCSYVHTCIIIKINCNFKKTCVLIYDSNLCSYVYSLFTNVYNNMHMCGIKLVIIILISI